MKLAYLELRQSGPTSSMVRFINTVLEERGTDASAIINVVAEKKGLDTWWTIFYREEGRDSKIIKAKDLRTDDIMVTDHNQHVKVGRVTVKAKEVTVHFPDGDSWGKYNPESDIRVLQ
jgi:hypothetical protein